MLSLVHVDTMDSMGGIDGVPLDSNWHVHTGDRGS